MATKKQKVTNVPNLRFPGFEAEWTKMNLGKASEKINSGKTPLGGESTYTTEGVVFIRSQNVNNDKLELNNTVFISEEVNNSMKNSVVRANDILLNITGASLGRCCVVPTDFETGNVNQHVCIIRLKDGYNPRFIQPKLSSSKGQNIFLSLQTGSGREGLNFESIKSIELDFPRKNEQDKIARFLSLIDQRIETQNKIIERLETLIKGLNEQLFNQKLRFKDDNGNDFSDWEIKSLGQVFSYKITNSYSREKLNYEEGNVKNIHYGDIHTQYRTLFNAQKENAPYINPDVNINKIEEENYCKKGDVIIADASEDLKDVGKSIELVSLNGQKILAGLHTILARPMGDIFSIGFCGYLFKSQKIRQQIQNEAQGSKVLSISASRLSKVVLCIPCLGEQTKIVDFLFGIDEKIETEKRVLKRYEFQKKYFLHELFI